MMSQISSWWYQLPKEPPKTTLQRTFTPVDLEIKKRHLKSPVILHCLARNKPNHLSSCKTSDDLLQQIKSIHLKKIVLPPRVNIYPPRSPVLQELLRKKKMVY